MTHFLFEYAILFPDGQYYTGPSNTASGIKQDQTHRGPIHKAYTYAERRAYQLLADYQDVFAGCEVRKVL